MSTLDALLNSAEATLRQMAVEFSARLDGAVGRLRAQGMGDEAIADALLADYDAGGPIIGNLSRSVGGAVEQTLGQIMTAEEQRTYYDKLGPALVDIERVGDEEAAAPRRADFGDEDTAYYAAMFDATPFTWIAMLIRSCADCVQRHGKTETGARWKQLGLPGSDVLACCSGPRKNCMCRLEPTKVLMDQYGAGTLKEVEKALGAPLLRRKREIQADGTARLEPRTFRWPREMNQRAASLGDVTDIRQRRALRELGRANQNEEEI